MDLFKLVGSIFIQNNGADAQIDTTTSKAKTMASTVGSALQTAGQKISNVGKALAPVSAAAGAVLAGSVKSASNFTDAMAKVSTLVDTSSVSIENLSKMFMDLSNETGKSATELAEAGYQALSASVPVEKLGAFTKTATDLAKVGFTDTTTAVDVLTTAINAFGLETEDADSIATKLVKTQNLGKTTVNELASSMGKIIPTAAGMNVNIDNLTAGYVTLTKQGIATAESTTYMNSMLNELGDSGTDVGGILKEKTGKSFQELMDGGASLGDVLAILKGHADETGTNFNELWGSAEAGKAALAIVNSGTDEFNATLETMKENTNEVSEGLQKLDTPSAKLQKSWNRVKNSGIQLGTAVLHAIAPALDRMSSAVEKATTWFNSLDEGTKTTIATVLGIVAALGPVLIVVGKIISAIGTIMTIIQKLTGVINAAKGVFAAFNAVCAANPYVIIIAAIVALVAAFIYLWNTSEGFRNFWINLWNTVSSTVMNVVSAIGAWLSAAWAAIVATATALWNDLKNTLTNILNGLKVIVSSVWNAIKSTVVNVVNGIKSTVTSVWNAIKSTVTSVMNGIKTTITTVWNAAKSAVTTAVNGIKSSISSALNSAKSTVSSVFSAIKSSISEKINAAKSAVTTAISAIKSAFNFSWSLPHLALPHLSISGGFSINPPSVPHFGISWYKKAMEEPFLFTKPTIFDVNPLTGQAKGAGEAGNEMMYGHESLMNDIRNASGSEELVKAINDWMERLYALLSKYLPELANMDVVMDTGTVVGELAPAMDRKLGEYSGRKDRWN